MAKALKTNLPLSGGRGNPKYKWNEWTDGRTWELTRGTDFDVPLMNFRNVCYVTASRKRLLVTVHVVDEKTVQIQFRRATT